MSFLSDCFCICLCEPRTETTREPTNHLEPAGQANFCWRFSRHHVIRIWKDRHLNLIKFHLSLTTVPQWWSVEHWQSQKSCLVVYYPEIWLGLLLSKLKLNTISKCGNKPTLWWSQRQCYLVIQRLRKIIYSRFY